MKKRKNRASRRITVRDACIIICLSLLFSIVFLFLRRLIPLTDGEQILLAFIEALVVMLLPAWVGLSGKGGLQMKSLHLAAIEPGKMVYLFLAGLFVLFPMTLTDEIIKSLLARGGIVPFRTALAGSSIFFPALLLFVMLRPCSATLFYCEFMTTALGRVEQRRIQMAQIILCTVQLGAYQGIGPAFIVSVPFIMCFHQSASIMAPVLLFAGYGFGDMVFDRLQSIGAFTSLSPISSIFLIIGTIIETYWMNRAFCIPARTERISLPEKLEFTKKERRLMIGTIAAVVSAVLVSEVLK